jgi:hypothetical protein
MSLLLWFVHIAILVACIFLKPELPQSGILAFMWIASLTSCIWITRPSPRLSTAIIVVSTLLVAIQIISILLQLSCFQGDCI